MKFMFSPPSLNDLIRLLKAWRFWSIGAVIGATIGAAAYFLVPPPFRAHAVVLVDFNLEQAWPAETDREQFYYLEREVRKLEEIAFSDQTMTRVRESGEGVSMARFRLSQPGAGGWNFYVDDPNAERAVAFANAWAQSFVDQVGKHKAEEGGPNAYIQAEVSREAAVPLQRSLMMSTYLFTGAVGFLVLGSIVFLFFTRQS